MKMVSRWITALWVAGAACAVAAETNRTWLASDYTGQRIAIYREGHGILWKHQTSGVYDVHARPNGNLVWADYDGVHEIVPDRQKGEGGKLLWKYIPGSAEPKFAGKAEVHSCEVQPDGTVAVLEAGSQRLVVLDPNGKVVRTVPVATAEKSIHHQFRLARRSPSGTQWIAGTAEALAREVTEDGTVKRTLAVPTTSTAKFRLYEALPLPNGNVLLGTATVAAVIEYDATGQVVWEFGNREAKAAGFQMKWISGITRLANGNTVVCDWQGSTHKAFEVTPDRKVVWVIDPALFQGLSGLKLLRP